MNAGWIVERRAPRPDQVQLFVFPYAGGSSAAFRGWHDRLPDWVALRLVELPGRGTRFNESPYCRLQPLVRALVEMFRQTEPASFAVFGHSMGGLIAFELARALRAADLRLPDALFISSTAAPTSRSTRPAVHMATDGELIERLRELAGTPPEVLASPELMSLLTGVLRADFAVLETHEPAEESPLDVPLTVFGGEHDPVVPPAALLGWRRESCHAVPVQLFPGGHFYLNELAGDLVADVVGRLRTVRSLERMT